LARPSLAHTEATQRVLAERHLMPKPSEKSRKAKVGKIRAMARRPSETSSDCPPQSAGRSRIMAGIRSKGNRTTELTLAALLRQNGIRGWRRHVDILGRPDFVFAKQRVAIFVDGCFWHGCQRCYQAPKWNSLYWAEKIRTNRARDTRISRTLKRQGWAVLRVWEHALEKPQEVIGKISAAISSYTPRGNSSVRSSRSKME
jgi:DNA mismatch endonuclease, patch repair protein